MLLQVSTLPWEMPRKHLLNRIELRHLIAPPEEPHQKNQLALLPIILL